MTESALRAPRLEVAEGLIEELVSAHKESETRAKKLEQQVFFYCKKKIPQGAGLCPQGVRDVCKKNWNSRCFFVVKNITEREKNTSSLN